MALMELDSNKHSVFLLFYHLILVVKYRKRVIDGRVSARLNHCLFKAKPTTALAKFINAYKNVSSRITKKEFPEIRKQLWKEYFWSRSYCLLTSGRVSVEVIKEYIRRQEDEKSL